jgi:hypothetical protein
LLLRNLFSNPPINLHGCLVGSLSSIVFVWLG